MFITELVLDSPSARLPSEDVMGRGAGAKFNHNSSHDRPTNAAIHERISLKRGVFHRACASHVLLSLTNI